MTRKNKKKVYKATIPIVVISVLILLFEFRTERCFGLADGIVTIFILGILILAVIVTVIIQIVKISKGQFIKLRITVIVACFLLTAITVSVTIAPQDYFKKSATLTAELTGTHDIGSLRLHKNNTYWAKYGHIDWSCIKTGNYEVVGDTIFLENKIVAQSDSIFSSSYLVKENYLIPLNKSHYSTKNQGRWEIKK